MEEGKGGEAQGVVAHVDSLLVSNQINGVYEIKEERMKQYVQVVEGLMAKFESCVVIHVPRSHNKKADALSKLASSFVDPVKEISVEEVLAPTIEVKMINVIQEDRENWMKPIVDYLVEGKLPESRVLAHKLRCKAQHYEMQGEALEERKERAALEEERYKRQLEKNYNKKVHPISLKKGEYVWRNNKVSKAGDQGKMGPNWEGPYVIDEALGKGAYSLTLVDGRKVPRTWNGAQLKKSRASAEDPQKVSYPQKVHARAQAWKTLKRSRTLKRYTHACKRGRPSKGDSPRNARGVDGVDPPTETVDGGELVDPFSASAGIREVDSREKLEGDG
ncbi:hypothetical protein E3N88_21533 [Mikania micrantha]|uniref:RNase H type-1 domain-containing protein n=1 Tax=Mikania micrantha TaxID=192012 RepID=A0A5N6NLR9_9ASTR|nr:hypothetical protein E3N88_21533 [Mikania micrantha]